MERRLTSAERASRTLTGRVDSQSPLDPVEAWVFRLCEGRAVIGTVKRMAEVRATRKAMLEGRWPLSTFRPPEFRQWVDDEIGALQPHIVEAGNPVADFFAAIDAWCDEPDALAWPPERTYGSARTEPASAQFWEWVDATRKHLDRQRASDRSGAWRAANPEWHRDMADEEFFAFDLKPLTADREALPDDR